jgi:hypothetical protein
MADAGQIDNATRVRASPETMTGIARRTLRVHPETACAAVKMIEVEVARPRPGTLIFTYVITGRIEFLAIPPLAYAARTDDLWQHTCFEAFLRNAAGEGYYEFNFAPSTQWAAYRFGGYRAERRDASEIDVPAIAIETGADRYCLRASLEVNRLQRLSPNGGMNASNPTGRFGLAAVIEETSGYRSYWALAHPPGKPDFHHADCFTLEVP